MPTGRSALAVAALGLLTWLAIAAGPAFAEPTHVFDAALSLTGTCETSSLDSMADPGCPASHAPQALEAANRPMLVDVDPGGDLYVLSGPFETERIDVFDSTGHWLFTVTENRLIEILGEEFSKFKESESSHINDIVVDSLGKLYVAATVDPKEDVSQSLTIGYMPSSYPPTPGATYSSPSVVFEEHNREMSLALDAEDRLYLDFGSEISEYKSAAEGNELLRTGIGVGTLSNSVNLAIGPGPAFEIYATAVKPGASPGGSEEEPFVSEVEVFDGATGTLLEEIDGSDTPNCAVVKGVTECGFSAPFGTLDVGVEAANGDVFVSDKESEAIYEFRRGEGPGSKYGFLPNSELEHSFNSRGGFNLPVVFSNAASSPDFGYVFTTGRSAGPDHLYAFKPKPAVGPPIITDPGVSGITRSEALLEAEINPNGAETEYHFEYVEEATYLKDVEEAGADHGFDHAASAPEPDALLPAGGEAVRVSVSLSGLGPGTTYRFRAVASNSCEETEPGEECISTGKEGRFATYPAASPSPSCPNESFRRGPSAVLPDCRAYELVTPPDTNGLAPIAFSIGVATTAWSAPLASPAGESILFATQGGSLPGYEGSGALSADGYKASRSSVNGWETEAGGPSGAQSQSPSPGSPSPDHDYWIWKTFSTDEGSLGPNATYVRKPDDGFELVGQGSRVAKGDPQARPRWISAGGGHMVFSSEVRLEDDAPPSGTEAIYDRPAAGGPTLVASLLPGEKTPASDASYQGASSDGSVVAFKVGGVLYVRIENAKTLQVASGEATFAGLSIQGRWLFYVEGGDIFSFDTVEGGEALRIGSGGESVPVNVSADGSHVYFVSPKVLDGASKGKAGEDNLYAWDRADGSIRLVAVVDPADVSGEELIGGKTLGGLGFWTSHAVSPDQNQFRGRSSDPSRTTPDGDVFVFESHANLTGYDAEGKREVYRYDARDESLLCVSCDPTLSAPSTDSKLVLLFDEGGLTNPLAEIANVSADGKEVFFQSTAALVPTDVNKALDVYEWHVPEPGICDRADGCLALISSGQGASDSFLYAMTPDGHDVFIRTADTLLPRDWDGTPSIYDARVNGGFPEEEAEPCLDEGCRQQAGSAPSLPAVGSAGFSGPGNPHPRRRCPHGKRKVHRAGKTKCVKRHKPRGGHRSRHRHRRAER